jgi:hypothetical protein
MKNNIPAYKRILFVSIIIIALGVNLSAIMDSKFASLGTVFIAIGGLFFIIAMRRKKEESEGRYSEGK